MFVSLSFVDGLFQKIRSFWAARVIFPMTVQSPDSVKQEPVGCDQCITARLYHSDFTTADHEILLDDVSCIYIYIYLVDKKKNHTLTLYHILS